MTIPPEISAAINEAIQHADNLQQQHEHKYHRKTETTPDFAEAWLRWPGRYNKERQKWKKVGRQDALERWSLLTPEAQQFILGLLRKNKIDKYDETLQDFHRWLEHQRWMDYGYDKPKPLNLPAEIKPKMKTVPSAGMTDAQINDVRNKNLNALKRK